MSASLLGLGSAFPELRQAARDTMEEQAALWGLPAAARARFQRMVAGSGVEWRHAVRPIRELMPLDTAARMRVFAEEAPPLAASACARALGAAGVAASEVTDLVVVTCTGFRAPGVGGELQSRLSLPAETRPAQLGFMGCFGGVCGVRTAGALAAAERRAVVLLVCVELCSLHLRADTDPGNLVASALFGDGAAAAVVAGRDASQRAAGAGRPRLSLAPGRTRTVPGTADAMSWTVTNEGFAMTLSREVPEALGRVLPEMVEAGETPLLHPGGPAILDEAEARLGAGSRAGISTSRSILRERGNVSSATILLVLERWLAAGGRGPLRLAAFGPGLTIDTVPLTPVGAAPDGEPLDAPGLAIVSE